MLLSHVCILAVFCPLVGFLIAVPYGRVNSPRLAQAITCLMMTISFVAAISLCWTVLRDNVNVTVNLFMWFKINHMRAYWGLKIDSLSAVMTLVVTFVSFLVHVYSLGYMKHDTSRHQRSDELSDHRQGYQS